MVFALVSSSPHAWTQPSDQARSEWPGIPASTSEADLVAQALASDPASARAAWLPLLIATPSVK